MKTVVIKGKNYLGHWNKTRMACRGIVIRNGFMLLSFETVTDQWMLPGGGVEENEDESACCVREVAEETGFVIRPSGCMLEIDEYYEDCKFMNRYYFGEVMETVPMRLTAQEKRMGMEPRWIAVEEALSIFSRHADYADTDEMRRGMYLREYTALRELIHQEKSL